MQAAGWRRNASTLFLASRALPRHRTAWSASVPHAPEGVPPAAHVRLAVQHGPPLAAETVVHHTLFSGQHFRDRSLQIGLVQIVGIQEYLPGIVMRSDGRGVDGEEDLIRRQIE